VSAHATTVELAVQVPPLVAEIRDIFLRHLDEIDRFPYTFDAAEAAAFRVLAASDIAAGLRATTALDELAPRLTALDARHQGRPWAGSSTGYVCTAGCGAHPCIDSQILNGTAVAS